MCVCVCVCIYIYIYIPTFPWIIRGKPHLDIGIINIDMDATTQCTYSMSTIMV